MVLKLLHLSILPNNMQIFSLKGAKQMAAFLFILSATALVFGISFAWV